MSFRPRQEQYDPQRTYNKQEREVVHEILSSLYREGDGMDKMTMLLEGIEEEVGKVCFADLQEIFYDWRLPFVMIAMPTHSYENGYVSQLPQTFGHQYPFYCFVVHYNPEIASPELLIDQIGLIDYEENLERLRWNTGKLVPREGHINSFSQN